MRGRSVATAPSGKSKRPGEGCCGKFEIVPSAEDDLHPMDRPGTPYFFYCVHFLGAQVAPPSSTCWSAGESVVGNACCPPPAGFTQS